MSNIPLVCSILLFEYHIPYLPRTMATPTTKHPNKKGHSNHCFLLYYMSAVFGLVY